MTGIVTKGGNGGQLSLLNDHQIVDRGKYKKKRFDLFKTVEDV